MSLRSTHVCLLLLFVCKAHALKASDFFQVCQRNDPKLQECVKGTIEKLRPSLLKGIPELRIPPIEPLSVSKVSIKQGSGPVSIDSTFTNLKIHGITNYKLLDASADPSKYTIEFKVSLPYLFVEGDYSIDGKVLVLPITGSGDSWSNYTEVTGVGKVRGQPVTRDGREFLQLHSLDFGISVKHAIIHMNNLFNGNKELGDAMNQFMIENWQVMFAEIKPVVDEAISAILTDLATKVFNKFPYNELFP